MAGWPTAGSLRLLNEEDAMHAQMVEAGEHRRRSMQELSPDERTFQERIDAEVRIKPKDWMPEAYRKR